jgi:hypothetical protein
MRDSAGSIAMSMVKTYSRPGNMPHSAGEILQPKAYICIDRVALVDMSSGVLVRNSACLWCGVGAEAAMEVSPLICSPHNKAQF